MKSLNFNETEDIIHSEEPPEKDARQVKFNLGNL